MIGADMGLFANDLYQQTTQIAGHGNLVLSPVCVQTVLGMLYIASRGRTADQMKKVLRLGSVSQEHFAEDYQTQLQNALGPNIAMANKVYVQTDYPIYQNYSEKVNKYFSSDVGSIDFTNNGEAARKINSWVAQKTNNKIHDLLSPGDVSSGAKMMLVNTLSVSGQWRRPFLPEATSKQNFFLNDKETVQVDMMKGVSFASIGRIADLDAVALSLPCKDSKINLLVVLPNRKNNLVGLENKLAHFDIQGISSQMHKTLVNIKLPKFEFESFFDLAKVLRKMGMEDAFTSAADFGGLSSNGNLAVSNVYHKAIVRVNEAGLEASAAASVQMIRLKGKRSEAFIADRPFWFAVRNDHTILFTGRFESPK